MWSRWPWRCATRHPERVSHQGYEGWFPECLNCGGGNVGPVVCLAPHQEDQHADRRSLDERSDPNLFQDGGHWFKKCQLCDLVMFSDPLAFGSFALCVSCWNSFVDQGFVPPTSGTEMRRLGDEGVRSLRSWPAR